MFAFDFTGQMKNRLPSVYVGLCLMLSVFVILTSQVGLYFWKRPVRGRHSLWIKVIVILIWSVLKYTNLDISTNGSADESRVIQALEVAVSCHMTAIAHKDDSLLPMDLIYDSVWDWAVYIGTSVITECLVHAFFISRIYLLESSAIHVRISILLYIILILEASFGIISMLFVILSNTNSSRRITIWAVPLWLGISIFIDISIAGTLCYILKKNTPYLSGRMNWLVGALVKFCIQTGLITSLATGATIAIWIVIQLDPGHLLMCFPMGGIYAACFMANLLARESYFCHTKVDENSECLDVAMENIVFASNMESENVTLTAD